MKIPGRAKLSRLISGFKGKKILVIGDLMVDDYIWGDVGRISPEAPIPVIEVKREESKPGGAANVMLNLIELGAKVSAAGVVGNDANAYKLLKYMKSRGIATQAVIEDRKRPTTVKTRVIAHQQQVVRIDKEKKIPLSASVIDRLVAAAVKAAKRADAVIFSDYNKGVLMWQTVEAVTAAAAGKIITVDPKPANIKIFRNITLITPNKKEAAEAAGIKILEEADIKRAASALKAMINAEAVLITRGEEGMTLYDGESIRTIPTLAREVYDVTGAGDTVISAATLALAAGGSFIEAAALANIAAGISVREVGVVTVSPVQLKKELPQ